MNALADAHDAAVQMLDTSIVVCVSMERASGETADSLSGGHGADDRQDSCARRCQWSACTASARNKVERFFNRIRQCRQVATRYDKLAANYLAFVQLASIRLWLAARNESTL